MATSTINILTICIAVFAICKFTQQLNTDNFATQRCVVFLYSFLRKDKVNSMKKLFISQPMRGKSDEDIMAERKKAIESAEKVIGEPVEVIDSFFQEAPVDAKPLWFLGKSLELLAGADIAYFAEGWQDARGCRIEHTCAVEYNIDRIEPQEGGDPDISL